MSKRLSDLRQRIGELRRGSSRPAVPDDPVEFAREVLRFNPYPYQERLLRDASNRIAVRFCRQSGKSYTLAGRGIIRACQNARKNILITAPGLRQSMLLMDLVHVHLNRMDAELRRQLFSSIGRTRVDLTNGSRLIALPCSEDLIRGITAFEILADEASFFEHDEYMFNNVLFPMLATTNGTLVASSTPWSTKSVFHEMCIGRLKGRFSQHYANWRDAVACGLISQTFIDDMRATLLPNQFTMEFEVEFAEGVDIWLTQELLAECVAADLEFTPFESQILPPLGALYMGVDFGKHQDFSVAAVVEILFDGKISLRHILQFPLETPYASVIGYAKSLQDRWGVRSVHADVTGVGDYIVEDMRRAGISRVDGVNFTVESKENMASVLKDRMIRKAFKMPYDRDVINELNVERYTLMKTGRIQFFHSEGTHDDRFWAVALAVAGAVAESRPGGPTASAGRRREE